MRWPWSKPRVVPRPRSAVWPKTVYFLDGPMAGKTGTSIGGRFVSVLYRTAPEPHTAAWFSADAPLPISSMHKSIKAWRYDWDTCYPRALVAYVRSAV